jgi:hypothetical protein
VCDFNLSKVIESSLASNFLSRDWMDANPRWLAPELLLPIGQATLASDVFAFGVVMWEVLTWDIPWHNYNDKQVRKRGRGWGGG